MFPGPIPPQPHPQGPPALFPAGLRSPRAPPAGRAPFHKRVPRRGPGLLGHVPLERGQCLPWGVAVPSLHAEKGPALQG